MPYSFPSRFRSEPLRRLTLLTALVGGLLAGLPGCSNDETGTLVPPVAVNPNRIGVPQAGIFPEGI